MSRPFTLPYAPNARCGLWVARGAELASWRRENTAFQSDAVTLAEAPDQSASRDANDTAAGSATGPVVETPFPFVNLVASWNAETPAGSTVTIETRVRIGQRWSKWYIMGRWSGAEHGESVPHQEDADGQVDVDTLMLHQPAQAAQLRLWLKSQGNAAPQVTLASLCWFNPAAPAPPAPALSDGWARTIGIPSFSQRIQDPRIAGEICSPTSLAMILEYYGAPCTPMEAAAGVRDIRADMYGNWPLNTAYAASRGCTAYVARFWCIEQLQNEIAAGRPVEASIRFGTDELTGAPIRSTAGHLVVVVGFTPDGDVVVHDPAAPDEETVQRVYRRQEFARAWLDGSGGIVYLVQPVKNAAAADPVPPVIGAADRTKG